MSNLIGNCEPGVRDASAYQDIVIDVDRVYPTYLHTVANYPGQVFGTHNRTKADNPPGRLRPNAYRVFAYSLKTNYHDFSFKVSSSRWRQSGKTPQAAGLGFSLNPTYGCKGVDNVTVPNVPTNIKNRAITEALVKIQDGKMNLLVSIAEARESINFIAFTMNRILRSYHFARKGQWSKAAAVLETGNSSGRVSRKSKPAANAVLSYHYAVLPLLGDIQGAFQLAHQGLKDNKAVVKAVRRVSTDFGLPPKPAHITPSTWRVSGYCKVGAECQIRAALDDPYISLLAQMGLYNPYLVAWELVTLSFVIDWLIPIGNSLSALTARLGLKYLDGYVNEKTVSKFSVTGTNRDYLEGKLPSADFQNVCQLRTPMIAFPSSRLYIKSPFSTSHVISAVALLRSLR